jgi:hypothetical protein
MKCGAKSTREGDKFQNSPSLCCAIFWRAHFFVSWHPAPSSLISKKMPVWFQGVPTHIFFPYRTRSISALVCSGEKKAGSDLAGVTLNKLRLYISPAVRRRRRPALRTNYRSHAFALNVQHVVPAGKEGCSQLIGRHNKRGFLSACRQQTHYVQPLACCASMWQ